MEGYDIVWYTETYCLPVTYMIPYGPDRVIVEGDYLVEDDRKDSERVRQFEAVPV